MRISTNIRELLKWVMSYAWKLQLLLLPFFISQQAAAQTAGALHFDGNGDNVAIPSSSTANNFTLSQDFTVSVKMRVPATQNWTVFGDNDVVEKWDGAGGYPFVIRLLNQTQGVNAGKITIGRWNGSVGAGVLSTATVNDNNWHDVAFVKSGATIYLYIDGVLQGSAADITSGTTNNSSALYLGKRGPAVPGFDNFYTGSLDELRIWNVGLSQSQIQNYNSLCQLTGTESNLVAYYNFNQGTIGANNSGVGTLNDFFGNHGTLSGFTLNGSTSNWVAGANNCLQGPAGINSGILSWLDASDVDADGNTGNNPANATSLANWQDKSGNNNDATQLSGQNAGVFRSDAGSLINTHPVVRFASSNVYNFGGIDIRAASKPDVSIITVYKQGSNNTNTGLWGNDNGNWDRFMYTSFPSGPGAGNGIASRGPNQTPPYTDIPGSGTSGKLYLFTGIYDGNVSGGVNSGPAGGSSFYFNGSLLGTFTDQTHPTDAQGTLRLGWDGDDGHFNGDIAEFIVYDRVLTACEIQQINVYLSNKYGVTFSTASITAGGATTFCEGGSVVLTASSGSAYQWKKDGNAIGGATSSTYTATQSGSYTVDITTACGVATSAATVVTVSQGTDFTVTPTNPSCAVANSGTVTVTNVTGGVAPYQYSLDNGAYGSSNTFTGLAPGAYAVHVKDAAGCIDTKAIGIIKPFCSVAKNDSVSTCANTPLTITLASLLGNDSIAPGDTVQLSDWSNPSQGTISYNSGSQTFIYTPPANYSGPASFTYTIKKKDNTLAFSGNGHFYEFVSGSLNWNAAKAAAETRFYNGMQGYLVTVTSAQEMSFVQSKLQGTGWMGASDLAFEGKWRWVTGPEGLEDGGQGRYFVDQHKTGNCSATVGTSVNGYYHNFHPGGEPNDCGVNLPTIYSPTDQTRPGEHVAHFYPDGIWNDFPYTAGVAGYVVEYGGMEITAPVNTTSTATVGINVIQVAATSTATAPSCPGGNNGTITVTAAAGIPPFQYSNNNGASFQSSNTFSGLTAGTYNMRVRDAKGCFANHTVVVPAGVDNTPPTVNCPTNITVGNAANQCGNTVNFSATGSDNCSAVTFTYSPNSGSFFAVGTTTVTVTAKDASNNTSTCSFTVTVADNQIPTITCPAAVTVNADPGQCGASAANVNLGTPAVSDNCNIASVAVNNPPSMYPLGTSFVTWIVTDVNGKTNSCVQAVTVLDNQAPNLTCPANILVNADNGQCGAGVTITPPTVTDNCMNNNFALSFEGQGSGDQVRAPYSTAMSQIEADDRVTVEGWVYIRSYTVGWYSVVDQRRNSGDDGWTLQINATNGLNWSTTNTDTYCPFTFNTNAWYHVALAYDRNASTARFYINGVLKQTSTLSNDLIATGNDLHIGFNPYGGDETNNGLVDEIRIWNTARTPAEIGANWNQILTGSEAGLAYYYDFNDGPGSSILKNRVAGSPDGTLFNMNTSTSWVGGAPISSVSVSNNANIANSFTATYPVGTSTIVWTAKDASNNTSTCTQTITVTDNQPPAITAPANVTVNADAGTCSATNVALGTPTTGDNCLVASVTNNGLSSYPKGTTTVTWTVTDNHGNSATATQTVTVIDNQLPVITCPANITVNAANGLCNAVVNTPPATATDNCTTFGFGPEMVANGDFAAGATNWNACGNIVEVNPETSYGGSNGGNRTAEIDPDNSGSTADDRMLCQNISGFVIGKTYTLTLRASRRITGGTPATVSANLVVNGGALNTVVSRSNTVYGYTTSTFTFTATQTTHQLTLRPPVQYGIGLGLIVDDISIKANGSTVTNSFNGTGNASGTYPVGTTTVTWTATDESGNSSTCTQTVTVVDNQNPVITCPANITQTADAGVCKAMVNTGAATATDNCSVTGIEGVRSDNRSLSDSYPVGATAIVWTATDINGNSSSCTQTITITDNESPRIVCPADINQTADAGVCKAMVNIGAATATDNCAVEGVSGVRSDNRSLSDSYPVGTTTIVWTATDIHGNSSSCTQTITVTDNENPVITCPANINQTADAGVCKAMVNIGAATATDNCGVGGIEGVRSDNRSLSDSYPVGTTTVVWTATDIHGNSSSCTQTIVVTDNENPVITCPANITQTADAGVCKAMISIGAATATDNCGVETVAGARSDNAHLDDSYPVGTTTVTWTATDIHGNSSTCTQTIVVTDNENPVITCPANITQTADAGVCKAMVNIGTATATDNCGVGGIEGVRSDNRSLSDSYPVGTTTVVWTATDIHGNSSSCTQTIVVTDNENPVITCPANITQTADAGVCKAMVNIGAATATDNCAVESIAGVRSDNAALTDSYPVGTTTVTWTATDIHGNSSTCTQTIVVTDDEDPVITCPANINNTADAGVCSYAVNIGTATATDNCAVSTISGVRSDAAALNAVYPVGTTTVTWTAVDIHGNSSTCTQTIVVTDNEKPNTICKPYTLNLSNGSGAITPADVDNGSTDNCAIATRTVSPNTFTCANAGANTVTLTITDIHGNISSCQTTVTVQYQPTCTISVTPSNNTYTGGVVTNIYLGYGPQSATITANPVGGTGFTYSWSGANLSKLSCTNCQSPVFTPTAGGTYTYTVTATNSNGCSTTCQVTFCVKDIRDGISNNPNSQKVFLCHVPPGNPANAHTISISINAVPSHLGLHGGDRLGKCDQSCTGAKGGDLEELAIGELKVYPNPTSGMFVIELPSEVKGGEAIIMDMSGKLIERKMFLPDSKLTFDLGYVAKGIYLVQVKNGTNIYHAKVTIN